MLSVGGCNKSELVYMWPGNSRQFWSIGYVFLKEDYPAGCIMSYIYDHRINPVSLNIIFRYY